MDHKREIERSLKLLKSVDPQEYEAILGLLGQIEKIESVENAKVNFLDFVKIMWPAFINGKHHKTMAEVIEGVVGGSRERVIINLAPRHSKSEFFSYLLPAWALGRYPAWKILQICSTGDMAIGWSRKVRNLVTTEEYQKIFPGTGLSVDSKAAGRWSTNGGGEYFAVGAEGNVTGKGGDLIIIDDPTGEQEAVSAIGDPSIYNKVYDWFIAGPRQRLQPGGRICVVQSRWATNDFTGRLIKAQTEADSDKADVWEIIELPAIMPTGTPLWPEYWSLDRLEATKIALPPNRWNAQYMQQPSNDSSSLIKREWWRRWVKPKPPECSIKIVAVDTAYSQKDAADFTAFTTWGIFSGVSEAFGEGPMRDPGGKNTANIILLDAWQERLEFPDLKTIAHKHWLKWKPDIFMVESKAAGTPLIYEMRARGVPVSEFSVSRGTKAAPNDKIARTNAVTDIFASGMVWAPETRWAEEVIQQCAEFPGGMNDDLHDTVVMALTRFRQGGFIELASDSWGDDEPVRRRRTGYY